MDDFTLIMICVSFFVVCVVMSLLAYLYNDSDEDTTIDAERLAAAQTRADNAAVAAANAREAAERLANANNATAEAKAEATRIAEELQRQLDDANKFLRDVAVNGDGTCGIGDANWCKPYENHEGDTVETVCKQWKCIPKHHTPLLEETGNVVNGAVFDLPTTYYNEDVGTPYIRMMGDFSCYPLCEDGQQCSESKCHTNEVVYLTYCGENCPDDDDANCVGGFCKSKSQSKDGNTYYAKKSEISKIRIIDNDTSEIKVAIRLVSDNSFHTWVTNKF
jgi:hypothetical protein